MNPRWFALSCLVMGCASLPKGYRSTPFGDDPAPGAPQTIPGRLECSRYDVGGEGVAYHDSDTINNGNGKLNRDPHHPRPHATPAVWTFRADEGVDLSYTKDFADSKGPNLVEPPLNQQYIGWAADGEWTNYTVDVKKAGTYRIVALYGNRVNTIRFAINYRFAAEASLPVATGSMHRWNKAEIGSITFEKTGRQLLWLFYNAGNNLAYFDFEFLRPAG